MADLKTCKVCNEVKLCDEFPLQRGGKDGLSCLCRECKRERDRVYAKRYYARDKPRAKAKNKKWEEANPDKMSEAKRKYREAHKDEMRVWQREYSQRNKCRLRAYAREYAKERRKVDMDFRLRDVLRKRLRNALSGRGKAESVMIMLGCTLEQLKQHLEAKFEGGMSWENYGFDGWHIDHIIPCAAFDLTQDEEQRKCFHHTNLQPLWAEANRRKGASVT